MSEYREHFGHLILERDLLGKRNPGFCLGCNETVDLVIETSSRTSYLWDGTGEDPNRDLTLCPECAIHHHEQWDSQWAEYYSMIR